jgi:hypothetical protein
MSGLRTWNTLQDPWGEVEGVRDSDGDLWRPGRDSGWFNCGQSPDAWTRTMERVGNDWENVMRFAPLREVTEHGDQAGTIEITQTMTDAADNVLISRGAANLTGGVIAATLAAALRAGGYDVTGVDET